MKHLLVLFVATTLFIPVLSAQLPKESGHGIEFLPTERKPTVGKALTDEELLAQRDATEFGGFKAQDSKSKSWDLLEHSDFIGMSGTYVILPKGSVVHVPEKLQSHILEAPEGTMLPWLDFLTRYRALIYPLDVTPEEVTGEKTISPAKLEAAARSQRIVVAVLSKNPVTVILPEEE